MKTKIDFQFNESTKETKCILRYGNYVCEGKARCHPDDLDMANPLTGQDIAYKRAVMKAIKNEIKEMRIELKALSQFFARVIQSKKVEDRCYVLYQLKKEINELDLEIHLLQEEYETIKNGLKVKLIAKDTLYEQLRKIRGKNK
jgi:hypothetical protein